MSAPSIGPRRDGESLADYAARLEGFLNYDGLRVSVHDAAVRRRLAEAKDQLRHSPEPPAPRRRKKKGE